MHVFGSKKPSASQIRAGFFPIIRDDETPKTDTYGNLIISVDKVSHFKSLTRLPDFFIKSHDIYETFETLKT